MSNKEKCKEYCKENLQGRNLLYVYDSSILDSYFRKHNGAQGNAFLIALKTADIMIEQFKPTYQPELEQYDPFFN